MLGKLLKIWSDWKLDLRWRVCFWSAYHNSRIATETNSNPETGLGTRKLTGSILGRDWWLYQAWTVCCVEDPKLQSYHHASTKPQHALWQHSNILYKQGDQNETHYRQASGWVKSWYAEIFWGAIRVFEQLWHCLGDPGVRSCVSVATQQQLPESKRVGNDSVRLRVQTRSPVTHCVWNELPHLGRTPWV